uniref:Uncharacterized protein n=1 Tax=Glossina austeni TaxID=7395 RepID=A0A1A9VUC2_GLOAU
MKQNSQLLRRISSRIRCNSSRLLIGRLAVVTSCIFTLVNLLFRAPTDLTKFLLTESPAVNYFSSLTSRDSGNLSHPVLDRKNVVTGKHFYATLFGYSFRDKHSANSSPNIEKQCQYHQIIKLVNK